MKTGKLVKDRHNREIFIYDNKSYKYDEIYNLIKDLDEQDILFSVIQKFAIAWDSLKELSNHDMWYVFEELIRRFNNENNKSAWEHFTPREVIKLMTNIIFIPVKDNIKNIPITIYDPCAGSWGMLSVSKEFLTGSESPINSVWNIFTYAQELNPETYALCKADMLLKWELNTLCGKILTISFWMLNSLGFFPDKYNLTPRKQDLG